MTQTASTKPARIEVFDPALCCSTGVCGTEVDQHLVTFAADAAWATAQGANLVRYNLAQQPLEFAQNTTVAQMLKVTGESALPLVLLDGQVALAGRYPTREELSRWLGGPVLSELAMTEPQACCGGDTSCC
ncbi:arsenite efflux transporter metallochaperone ArsD [Deinococcus sp. SL84]|uniref:arsenite efflux transporter metallochaperone ArsD n=1 Tax=Deinococcus sp. SL84 TaxID=2994663 RepID=UPI002273B25C|nr:arsenite efflux transporter metallochaperone ArsD [Deinococcus sp. SL84]MCY1703776.1 arsenite efflux transporter metallochaperone ArsD [Deinococcus sp. SL84]